MELRELLRAQHEQQPNDPTWTPEWQPEVAELIARWMDNQTRCTHLTDGDRDFIDTVCWELVDDPKWQATPRLLKHIEHLNHVMARWVRRFG